ncbi:hypothetical protein H5T87_03055 [bacterium]|nr:hypothetical protein [bacterium]
MIKFLLEWIIPKMRVSIGKTKRKRKARKVSWLNKMREFSGGMFSTGIFRLLCEAIIWATL